MNYTAARADLHVRDLQPDGMERWDEFVASCPEATFFHRAGWKPVIERSFGHRTYFLYAEQAGEIRGVLPLVHIRSRAFGNALISMAFCVEGGVATMDERSRQALDARANSLADTLDVDYLEYRGIRRTHPEWVCQGELYASFRKTLEADPDRALLSIPRKQRAVVRRSLAAGLGAELQDEVDALYDIYAVSVRNLGTPVFPRAYFRELKREFGDACECLVIFAGRQAVSAVMSFYFRDQVLPYYGGGTTNARRLGANDFMYWDLMRRACGSGRRVFDFGRSKRGTGAYAFKKNWGFKPQPLFHEYKLRRGALPEVNPLNPKYQLLIALWKRLPLVVANRAGPLIARNLG